MEVLAEYGPFNGGEYGVELASPPPQTFTGENVFVMPSGGIAPRNGVKLFTPSGIGANPVLCMFPIGEFYIGVIIGTTVWAWDGSTGAATNIGSVGGTPPGQCGWVTESASTTIITIFNIGVYRISTSAVTSLGIATANSGNFVAILGDRLWIGSIPSFANRIVYSNPAAFGTIGANSFLDVSGSTQQTLALMFRQRDTIILQVNDGIRSGTFKRISGTPGSSLAIRTLGSGPALGGVVGQTSAIGHNATIWMFVKGIGYDVFHSFASLTSDIPVPTDKFNHEIDTQVPLASVNNTLAAARVDRNMVAFLWSSNAGTTAAYNRIMLFDGQRWTGHRLYAGIIPKWCVALGNLDGWMFCDGGAAATAPKFYFLPWSQDRVQNANLLGNLTRDDATAMVATAILPIRWAEPNTLFRAQAVIVDFRQWNTGETVSGRYNHFDVNVTTLGVGAGLDGTDQTGAGGTAGSHDTDPALVTTNGTWYRTVHYIGNPFTQPGNGLEVTFTNMRGICIEKVTVMGEVMPAGI